VSADAVVPAASAVWAVVPVKGFTRGKSRLGSVLSDSVRSAFARGLFEHVVSTLKGHPLIAGVVVMTEDDEVAEAAEARGASVLRDPEPGSLSAVVDAGLAHAHARGASAGFVCMADLPHLTVLDVNAVIAELGEHDVVLTPDLLRAGTNVLCLAPASRMPSCFGRADSFVQHLNRARAAGLNVQVVERHGLCFDVDDPSDLERMGPPEG